MLEPVPLRAEYPKQWVATMLRISQHNLIWIQAQKEKTLCKSSSSIENVLNFLGKALSKESACRKVRHHRSSLTPSWEIFHFVPVTP